MYVVNQISNAYLVGICKFISIFTNQIYNLFIFEKYFSKLITPLFNFLA
ncbi:hypothetical protein H1P_780015 [Hyella patelloides LEGE 07179]|uniref:Uncharacterized protein n=1 Tax=Hyella patelloides LEGE 07179 TaxID=945734 RepID=A0A563W410_9CYAN|nr:hypothetical protein H1P_780015 [Hyella patelloides LEGE 07179]